MHQPVIDRNLTIAIWFGSAPALVMYTVFMLYPILSSLVLVTQKWKGFTSQYIGLGNFFRMGRDKLFWQAFVLNSDFGYASALSYVMVLVAGILAYIQVKLLRERA